jgi:hypothetical protein
MALVDCPECGKKVSDRGVTCPYCAFPLQGDAGEWKGLELLSGLGGLVSFAGVLFTMRPELSENWVVFWGICFLVNLGIFIFARIKAWWRHR